MIDDTPEVRWSNAWWCWLFVGIILPIVFLGLIVVGMIRQEGYAIGLSRSHSTFEVVYGFGARLMWIAYGGAALAAFGYGFARNHPQLDVVADPLRAIGLLAAAVCIGWVVLLNVI
ncbi:hypothetical protein BH09VER1_BH09VER1_23470 [soil metagenome]